MLHTYAYIYISSFAYLYQTKQSNNLSESLLHTSMNKQLKSNSRIKCTEKTDKNK